MQEKKNKILLVSLLALTTVAAVLLLVNPESDSNINKDLFKVEEPRTVDKIELKQQGKKLTLEFDGARWLVNATKSADERPVTVLLATLNQIELKRPVAVSIADSIRSLLRSRGIDVSIFVKGNPVRQFHVGGNLNKTESYIQDEDHGPYVVAIPGYRVYVAGVFEVDALGWRDKRIFNFNWRNFKSLSASLASPTNQNFEIKNQKNGFDIIGAVDTDTTKLNDYLDAVSLLTANQLIHDGLNKRYDSLSKTKSSLKIEIQDIGANKFTLELYAPLNRDSNILGKMDDGTLALFTDKQIRPILKTKDYFRAMGP